MERLVVIIFVWFLSLSSHATDLVQIYDVIKHVETNNKDSAVGDNGKAYGVVQIHKICVADINRIYKTNYLHKDAFNKDCAREMFMLYISEGIRLFKVKHCRSPTEGQIVRMWNGGIYRGYFKKATLKYLKRYYIYKTYLKNQKGLRC